MKSSNGNESCMRVLQLLYGFLAWMAGFKHMGRLRELRKARETRSKGELDQAILKRNHKVIVFFKIACI